MPDLSEAEVKRRAEQDAAEGKSPSTQAGEFVREEIEHVRQGKHGARNTRQAIAIGLSKARRAGVKLPPPKSGNAELRRRARRDSQKGVEGQTTPSRKRSRAVLGALRREPQSSASRRALSRQAKTVARRRGSQARHRAAQKAARTRARRRG
jgi:hypothetical protein